MAGVRPQLKVAVSLFRTTQGSGYTTLDVETGNALNRAIWNNNGRAKHTPSKLAEVKTTLSREEKRKRNTNVQVTTQNLVASVGYANVDRTRAKTQRKKRVLKAPDRASQGVVHRKVMTKISRFKPEETDGDDNQVREREREATKVQADKQACSALLRSLLNQLFF